MDGKVSFHAPNFGTSSPPVLFLPQRAFFALSARRIVMNGLIYLVGLVVVVVAVLSFFGLR
jgi:hypothetical protein